jgi:hypothetical protein
MHRSYSNYTVHRCTVAQGISNAPSLLLNRSPSCRAPQGRLPTRQVVTEDGPHRPVELVTIAPGTAGFVLAGRALHVPVAPASCGLPRTTAVGQERP